MRYFLLIIALTLPVNFTSAGENWPEFRGPTADGRSDSTGLPITLGDTKNVVWKTPIHDRGWSSPVIWGDQIWMTTATEDGKELFAVCVDRRSGTIVHDLKVFDVEDPLDIAPINSYASPTPAIEDGRVYVHYGSYGTACLDTDSGEILWTRRDLNCEHHMGPGSSPILFDDKLIFDADGIDVQYVVALNKRTGKNVWRTDRSVDYTDIHPWTRKAFATPRVIDVGGRLQLISPCSRAVMGYDLDTGEELWKIRHYGWSMVARPLFGHGLVFIVVDFDRSQLWALRPDGQGDVTDSHVAWKLEKGVPSTPSLLLIDDLLYMITDQGVALCVEAKTGEVVWRERIGGNYSASPIYADGRIYLASHQGVVTVLEPGREFTILASNELDEQIMASPAVSGKALFLRTKSHLYRFEK